MIDRQPPAAIEKARAEMTVRQATDEHAAFMERARKIIETAMKFKKALQKRGLTRGKAKCPFCEAGFLHGRLAGRKDHLHMACDGCDAMMME